MLNLQPSTAALIILILFALHWYSTIFIQTFFHHRYAAHGMFTMSAFWERFFHIFTFVTQGSSYLSPFAYGVMHRMHHAYADTEKDPHSPKYDKTIWKMMWKTKNIYQYINEKKMMIDAKFVKGVPKWRSFDFFAQSAWIRAIWVAIYVGTYVVLGAPWWLYFLIPIHALMGPFHGAIINWGAHKWGYTNFKVADTSKNMFPVDLIMMGEGLHNNHHKFGGRVKFSTRWFEFDPTYWIIRVLDFLRVIQIKRKVDQTALFL